MQHTLISTQCLPAHLPLPCKPLPLCRSSPKSAELWEGLGSAYQALGRHASALKSYGRALELSPDRPYCLMAAGALDYINGAYISAGTSITSIE